MPAVLGAMPETIVAKARLIKNPVEAAFFLWINLAYLQPSEASKKRTSRLAANIPLMLYSCSPLSFLDVAPRDYARNAWRVRIAECRARRRPVRLDLPALVTG